MKLACFRKVKKKMAGITMAMVIAISAVSPVFANDEDLQMQVLETEVEEQNNYGESLTNVSDNTENNNIPGEDLELDTTSNLEGKEDLVIAKQEELNEVDFNLISIQKIDLSGEYIDGEYEGTGTGRNGDIVLKVTISNNEITNIEVLSQEETPSYWDKAKALLETIINQNSTDVDAVATASISRRAKSILGNPYS